MTDTETRYADSDGVSIAYQVHGGGPLDLVFVPGFVSHVELFLHRGREVKAMGRVLSTFDGPAGRSAASAPAGRSGEARDSSSGPEIPSTRCSPACPPLTT